MNPAIKFPNYEDVFVKIEKNINRNELHSLFPNGLISFATQLSRENKTAIILYDAFNK